MIRAACSTFLQTVLHDSLRLMVVTGLLMTAMDYSEKNSDFERAITLQHFTLTSRFQFGKIT